VTPEEQITKERGAEGRVSPIYDAYNGNGGIGAVQYINVTHNTAAIVLPNGSLKSGGGCGCLPGLDSGPILSRSRSLECYPATVTTRGKCYSPKP